MKISIIVRVKPCHADADIFSNYKQCISCNTASYIYPIETPFNIFANRADPDQAALVRDA